MTFEDRIKVVEVMALAMDPPAVFDVETSLREVIHRMRDENVGCALLTRDGELAGIFTERDALARVAAEELDPAGIAVRDVMTPDPETVKRDHPLAHATHLMVVSDLSYLPLIDDDEAPIGVISSRDLIDYVASLVMGWEQEP